MAGSTPDYDVIVAGGGVAGTVAAIAAARLGARTLVIERLNCIGGNFTGGMMGTVWTFNDQEKLVVKGIPLEIVERLRQRGGVVSNDITRDKFTIYDTELAKFVLFEMAEEAGLDILLHTMLADVIVEDGAVQAVVVQNKSGRQTISCSVLVDASGDADAAALAGAPFELPHKQKLHPASLLARLGGVDVQALTDYYAEHPQYLGNFTGGAPHPGFHAYRLTGPLRDVHDRGALPAEFHYLMDWFILFYSTPHPGEITINMTGATDIDGTDARDLTRAEITSRKRLLQALDCYRRFIPGFAKAYIIQTGIAVGVRETRRIIGEYVLTKDDIAATRRFPDAVASYAAAIGHHTADGRDTEWTELQSGRSYDFPYRVLLPQRIDGLLVAGRCISVAADGIGSTRNMTSCMATGQAAGTAAALSAQSGVTPRRLDVRRLQDTLIGQGAYIEGLMHAMA